MQRERYPVTGASTFDCPNCNRAMAKLGLKPVVRSIPDETINLEEPVEDTEPQTPELPSRTSKFKLGSVVDGEIIPGSFVEETKEESDDPWAEESSLEPYSYRSVKVVATQNGNITEKKMVEVNGHQRYFINGVEVSKREFHM